MVNSSCSTVDTLRDTIFTNPESNHEWGKDGIVFPTNATYSWSCL